MASSFTFVLICLLHSLIALTCGTLMMFFSPDNSELQGSTPHDQLLIQTSKSFSGLLLFAIGFMLLMVAFVKDREFQSFFAKGGVLVHVSMAIWRFGFLRNNVEDFKYDWGRKIIGDLALGVSWVFFLVYSWREKYD